EGGRSCTPGGHATGAERLTSGHAGGPFSTPRTHVPVVRERTARRPDNEPARARSGGSASDRARRSGRRSRAGVSAGRRGTATGGERPEAPPGPPKSVAVPQRQATGDLDTPRRRRAIISRRAGFPPSAIASDAGSVFDRVSRRANALWQVPSGPLRGNLAR